MSDFGYLKGDVCNRNGCDGIIEHYREGSCSCHINPPCGYCTDDGAACPKCGWENANEVRSFIKEVVQTRVVGDDRVDNGRLYEVRRYFDDHLEAVIARGLTYTAAATLADQKNSRPRCYVNHSIHEQTN